MTKPLASLSLDLDNKWCYLRTHGVVGWDKYPSYLDVAVPRVLRTCMARGVRLTCFVVGRDAGIEANGDSLAALAAADFEIGNHTLNHEPWLHTLAREKLETEIAVAEEWIERATGQRPIGFRSPAYSSADETLEILAQRGYLYDATTLPTYLGPLMRWYFRHTASPDAAAEAERRELFGSLWDGLRSIRPYAWQTAAGPLVEIPVTTVPLVKLPFHMTYLWYLWQVSPALARAYFHAALWTCRRTGVRPSMLLHPLDFLGVEDEPELRFFPGMMLPRAAKLEFVDEVLAALAAHYELVPLREFARQVCRDLGLRIPAGTRPMRPAAQPVDDELVAPDAIPG